MQMRKASILSQAHTEPATQAIGSEALARILPMHAVLDRQGRMLSTGPTLAKLVGGAQGFFDAFRLVPADDGNRRPPEATIERLLSMPQFSAGLRCAPGLVLRGAMVPLEGGRVLVNLGFGVSLPEAVRGFGLTSSDFPAADLVMEFLFLHEANRAALALLGDVNLSLGQVAADAQRMSLTDPLTGLANRRSFDDEFAKAFEARERLPFALLHLDLDDFKAINDNFGHGAGDDVLRQVAQAIRTATRAQDLAFRVGGDEFMILVFLSEPMPDVQAIAGRVIEQVARGTRSFLPSGVSVSIGVAMSRQGFAGCEQMQLRADEALYAAKLSGKGRGVMGALPPGTG